MRHSWLRYKWLAFPVLICLIISAEIHPQNSGLLLSRAQLENIVQLQQPQQISSYLDEIQALGPRSIGSPGLAATAKWLKKQLTQIGFEILGSQQFTVTAPVDNGSLLTVASGQDSAATFPIYSLWPNLVAVPFLPDTGLTAPLIFVGKGSLQNYDGQQIVTDGKPGVIALMEYESGRNWETAAALGASAVVFLSDSQATFDENITKFINAPLQFPRFYLPDEKVAEKLKSMAAQGVTVTLTGGMAWHAVSCENILAFLPASKSPEDVETLMLSLNYDANSVVPGIAQGGISAENLSVTLETLKILADPQFDVERKQNILVFFGGAKSIGYRAFREFGRMLRDMHGTRRLELLKAKSDGASLSDRQNWLIDNFPDLQPWMDERLEIYTVKEGRLKAAIQWLMNNPESSSEFTYQDPVSVSPSDFFQYIDAKEWLYESMKKQLKNLHIEHIVSAGDLKKKHGIKFGESESRYPADLQRELHNKAYYSALLEGTTPQKILHTFNNYPLETGLLDSVDLTRIRLIQRFEADLSILNQKLSRLRNNIELREKLAALHINRSILIDLSSGNQMQVLFSALSHTGEFAWGIGPLISQQLETISNLGNITLYQPLSSIFDFVDAVTANASKKRKANQVSLPLVFGYPNIHFMQAGVSTYVLGTGNDRRPQRLGPGERIKTDPATLANLSIHARTLILVLSHALQSPRLFQLRSQEVRHETLNIRGVVVKQDVRSGPFPNLPIPGTIVSYMNFPTAYSPSQSSFTGSVFEGEFYIAGREGKFEFEDLPAEAWKRGITRPELTLNAIRLSRKNGMVEYAPDTQFQLGGTEPVVNLKLRSDVYRRLVVFEGACVQLYGGIDPMQLSPFNNLQIYESKSGSLDHLFIFQELPDSPDKSIAKIAVVPKNSQVKFIAGTGEPGKAILHRMFLLGSQEFQPGGIGYNSGEGLNLTRSVLSSARDIWKLNDLRLKNLEAKGIRNEVAHQLHDQSEQDLKQMENALEANQYSTAFYITRNIWGRELRAYPEIKSIADQAVLAVIILIAFLIPWAYFMERIILQSRTIAGRIGGFLLIFTLAAVFLFFLHPAFQITTSPLMILIAYTLGGMAMISLAVVMKKYSGVMKRWRMKIGGIHSSDIARGSAFAIAFNLGLTNMTKRPLRTSLTILTVSLLVFSATTFTSIETFLDTRYIPLPSNQKVNYDGILFRQQAYSTMSPVTAQTFEGDLPAKVKTVRRMWYQKTQGGMGSRSGNNKFTFTRVDTNLSHSVECLQAFMVAESEFSGIDEFVTGRWFSGKENEVILPTRVAKRLGISAGDVENVEDQNQVLVSFGPEIYRVIGILNSRAAEQLTDVSGNPLMHLDYNASGLFTQEKPDIAYKPDFAPVGQEGQLVFYRFDQTVLLPYSKLKNLGGYIKNIAAKIPDHLDARSVVDALMSRLSINIFASIDGKPYLVKTANSQSISGIWTIVLPVLLVILIMVNTMTGTVEERKEEIKMLGAVGLSPKHVSTLYLAESCVYGVCGVVFGVFMGLIIGVITRDVDMGLNVNYASVSTILMGIFVMAIVIVATLIPANLAARLSTPSGAGKWQFKTSGDDEIELRLPFTMTRSNGLGIFAFLYEYLDGHWESTSADFRCTELRGDLSKQDSVRPVLTITGKIWLAPYDMRVSQDIRILLSQMHNDTLFEVFFFARRLTGELNAWERANYVFIDLLRKQFLIFRTLDESQKKTYRESAVRVFTQAVEVVDV